MICASSPTSGIQITLHPSCLGINFILQTIRDAAHTRHNSKAQRWPIASRFPSSLFPKNSVSSSTPMYLQAPHISPSSSPHSNPPIPPAYNSPRPLDPFFPSSSHVAKSTPKPTPSSMPKQQLRSLTPSRRSASSQPHLASPTIGF